MVMFQFVRIMPQNISAWVGINT